MFVNIRGSFVGTREDMAQSLAFAPAGKVKADYELAPLSNINAILQRLGHGDVASRVILDFVTASSDRAGRNQPELAVAR